MTFGWGSRAAEGASDFTIEDQQDVDFSDRTGIINAIHMRPSFPCKGFVRGARLTFVHPTFKENFRAALRDNLHADTELGERARKSGLRSVEDVIRALGENMLASYRAQPLADLSQKQEAVPSTKPKRAKNADLEKAEAMSALIDQLIDLSEKTAMQMVGSREAQERSLAHIRDKIRGVAINDQFEVQAPVTADREPSRFFVEVPTGDSQVNLLISPEELAAKPLSEEVLDDLNTLRNEVLDEGSDRSRIDMRWISADPNGYRLRARWEGYEHSQNISIFEDCSSDHRDLPGCRDLIDQFGNDTFESVTSFFALLNGNPITRQDGEAQNVRVERRRETMVEFCGGEYKAENGQAELRRQPCSRLLLAAYYWLAPIDWLLEIVPGLVDGNDEPIDPVVASSALKRYAEHFSNIEQNFPVDALRRSFFQEADADGQADAGSRKSNTKTGSSGIGDDDIAYVALRAIANWARRWFRIADMDDHQRYRNDFVFSFVSGGRALLISDLRPDRNSGDVPRTFHDHPTRTLIVDLGLSEEQRGRTLARVMDLATYRHLALRGQPYVQAAIDSLTEVGKVLSLTTAPKRVDYPEKKFNLGIFYKKSFKNLLTIEDDQMKVLTDRMRSASSVLDRLNLFFTYGVSAKRDSTSVYA